jgi:hypothetical protein
MTHPNWPAEAEQARPEQARPEQTWPGSTGEPAAAPSRRRPLLFIALMLLPLLGILAFLIVVYQPFADAVGGCGGG